jgi:CRISPR-associated endonuclease/helicase Cas3
LAAGFSRPFGASDWGYLAGLWHDLGKYSAEFQARIARESGYDPEAHIEGSTGKVNHSSAGALYAVEKLGDRGRLLAYLIAGHHAGLPDWHGDDNAAAALVNRLSEHKHLDKVPQAGVPADILAPHVAPSSKCPGGKDGMALWMRILFSCLVDADFLDTEAFMDAHASTQRGSYPKPTELLACFNRYMLKFESADPTAVNRIRAQVLSECRSRASDPPGIFSLTVPTGGGKTLSSLAFALKHAVRHDKPRVIYAIPYTSIIEQTADSFRDIFGDNVIEHHSNLDPDQETAKSRLAAENWDAPLIVTTNVQFFESLFAARTSRCRKLHNIVNSVVVLDETQLLPPEFLQPILDVVNLLSRFYGGTFVLSTATQPAFNSRQGLGWSFRGLENVREIMADPDCLYRDLKRVTVALPDDMQTRRSWAEVAQELKSHVTVLAVVNTRSDCRELHRLMPDGTLHLSAAMCGEHRARVIGEIKSRLKNGVPTRVVSTQLVEAGVDLDFPVVYRALSGLDSIAQAAGRCNREGKLAQGRVVVFVPPKSSPPGSLRRAEQTTISLLGDMDADPMARGIFPRYFEQFYWRAPTLDAQQINDLLCADARELKIQFRTAASRFQLIDDKASQSLLVWYGESRPLIEKLAKDGPERWLMRRLQRYCVNLSRKAVEKLIATGEVREVYPGIFAQAVDTLYDGEIGVVLEGDLPPEQLVI